MSTDQIIAAATVVNALVLIFAAGFGWVQVKVARESTEAQMRPWVVVDLDALTRPPLMFLYVENIGRTVASDVSITFDPPLRSTFDDDERKFADLPLFSRLIPTLPPQKKIETLLDSAIQRLQTDLESSYEAAVRYTGQVPGQKSKTYTETHAIDIGVLLGIEYTTVRTLNDIYDELKKLVKTTGTWSAGITSRSGLVVKTPDDMRAEHELVRHRHEEARQSREAEKAGADLEGPPEILTVNYEIQRQQGYHDRLRTLVNAKGDRDQEAINAFTEGFLIHYRNLLDFLDSRGGDDDIKATDFVPEFKSTLSPEKYRERINKRLSHLSRSRSQYPKEWEFRTMLAEIRDAWDEFIEALLSTAEEE